MKLPSPPNAANVVDLQKWADQITSYLGDPDIQLVRIIGGQTKTFTANIGNVTVGNYVEIESDGTLEFKGDATVYDDLQVGLSSAKRPSAGAPTWRTFAYGIGGGVTFFTLGFAIGEYIEFKIQTTHSTKILSMIDSHIHWTIPSDSIGDKMKFQLDIIYANRFEDYGVIAGSPFSAESTFDGTESGKHNKLDIAEMPTVNTDISTIYICRLTRIAASSDDYANEVYVDFNDSHVQKDTVGSRTEMAK